MKISKLVVHYHRKVALSGYQNFDVGGGLEIDIEDGDDWVKIWEEKVREVYEVVERKAEELKGEIESGEVVDLRGGD
jgi:diaminopimelate decarboxylase